MKKLLSALLAVSITVASAMPVFAKDSFTDVSPTSEYSWAYSYVESMAKKGLIAGIGDGKFGPGNLLSRRDGFALFARLMGSNNEVNAAILEQAKKKYKDVLSDYNLSYAEGEIAFMLSKNIITEKELDTYFDGSKPTEPMPRYEAAILITKVMLGERAVKNEVLTDLDYVDVALIPKKARQYVYYVTKNGIMSGVGDNTFDPEGSVTRAQIAVMLSKTDEYTEYTFENVTVLGVDENEKSIEIKDAKGSKYAVDYDDDSEFFKNGEPVKATDILGGYNTVLTSITKDDERKIAFVETIAADVVETSSVIYKSFTSLGGVLKMTCADPTSEAGMTYEIDDNVVILLDGMPGELGNLSSGDYITIGLKDDKIVKIEAMKKNAKIDAVIADIDPMGKITIESEEEGFNGAVLAVAKDISIVKNGEKTKFSDLGRGDNVKIDIQYGIVTKIVATSSTRTYSGVLTAYTISSKPSISINSNGSDLDFDIPANAEITFNGEAATLEKFIIGSGVTLTVESNVARKIAATNASETSSDTRVRGEVVGINGDTIQIRSTENGGEMYIAMRSTSSTRIMKIPQFSDCTLKDIKVGDTIEAYGSNTTGIFVCSSILLTPAKN